MSEKYIWPDRLMIRDTTLHDDLGGLGQRIYTTAGAGYEKREYVRADLAAQPAADTIAKPQGSHALGARVGKKFSFSFDTDEEAEQAFQRVAQLLKLQTSRPPTDRNIPSNQQLRAIAQAVVDWNTKYPSSQIYSEGEIRAIAKQMDAIFEQAKQVLAAQDETECAAPIETAPQDGTFILGWNKDYGWRETQSVTFQPGSPGYAQGRTDRWWTWDEPKKGWAFHWEPTHWLPLPPSPVKTPVPRERDVRIDAEEFPEGPL